MATYTYNKAKYLVLTAGLDWADDDIRCFPVSSTYTYAATHAFVSDISSYILTGTTPRVALANKAVTVDGNNRNLIADALAFGSITTGQTIGGVVVYKYNASDASAALLYFLDLPNTPTNGGNINLAWATNGVAVVSAVSGNDKMFPDALTRFVNAEFDLSVENKVKWVLVKSSYTYDSTDTIYGDIGAGNIIQDAATSDQTELWINTTVDPTGWWFAGTPGNGNNTDPVDGQTVGSVITYYDAGGGNLRLLWFSDCINQSTTGLTLMIPYIPLDAVGDPKGIKILST